MNAFWAVAGAGLLGELVMLNLLVDYGVANAQPPGFYAVVSAFGLLLLGGTGGLVFQIRRDLEAARSFSRIRLSEFLLIPVAVGLVVKLSQGAFPEANALIVAILFAGIQFWACMDTNRLELESTGPRLTHIAGSVAFAFGLMITCVTAIILVYILIRDGLGEGIIDYLKQMYVDDLRSRGDRIILIPARIGIIALPAGWIARRLARWWESARSDAPPHEA